MSFTPVEIVALVTVIVGFIKLIFAVSFSDSYYRFEKKLFSHPKMLSTAMLLLAIVVLYVLLGELTITQIFASAAFIGLLIGVWFAFFGIEIVELKRAFIGKGQWKKAWWYLSIWVVIMVWVLEEILTK